MPVEVKNREFYSRLLLSLKAIERGYSVIFGRESQVKYRMSEFPRGIYFSKILNPGSYEWHLNNTFKYGHVLVSNDEEGLASAVNKNIYLSHRQSQELLERVHRFYAWGPSEADIISSNFKEIEHKVLPVGNPRVDIWKTGTAQMYSDEKGKFKKAYGPYILMPSSFSMVRHLNGYEHVYQSYARNNFFEKKEFKKEFDQLYAFRKEGLEKFVSAAKKIADTFDINVVVRPHLSESMDAWIEDFKDFDNILIKREGDIGPWILGSEIVLHSFCTTGIEAFLMKKPLISYNASEVHEYSNFVAGKLGLIAKEEDEVIQYVSDILDGTIDRRAYQDESVAVLSEYIANAPDGVSSVDVILNDMDQIDLTESSFDNYKSFRYRLLKKTTREKINALLGRTKKIKNPSMEKLFLQLFPRLSKSELIDAITTLSEFNNKGLRVRVNQIDQDVFLLTKK